MVRSLLPRYFVYLQPFLSTPIINKNYITYFRLFFIFIYLINLPYHLHNSSKVNLILLILRYCWRIITMEADESYYTVLGLKCDSSFDDIRRAYRKLAMVIHCLISLFCWNLYWYNLKFWNPIRFRFFGYISYR